MRRVRLGVNRRFGRAIVQRPSNVAEIGRIGLGILVGELLSDLLWFMPLVGILVMEARRRCRGSAAEIESAVLAMRSCKLQFQVGRCAAHSVTKLSSSAFFCSPRSTRARQ